MKASLILKCDGRVQDGFKFCSGTRNEILDLSKVEHRPEYLDVVTYLDRVVKIFDGPCFNTNLVTNAIYKLLSFGLIDEKLYKNISHYYELHKRCGIILECSPHSTKEPLNE